MLDDVKAEPSVPATRPALTSSARDDRVDPWSGREKASGGVESEKYEVPADGRRLGRRVEDD